MPLTEGETRTITKSVVRHVCEFCSEVADQKHTYLLPDCRTNRASSAFGRDDCSWCSDHEIFTCAECRKEHGNHPSVDGYSHCSTFYANRPQLAHLFLHWKETETPAQPGYEELLAACQAAIEATGGSEVWNGETKRFLELCEAAVAKATVAV